MRRLILAAFAVLAVATLSQPAAAADTVFIMRHLQKAEGADPPLSPEGAANAQALATMLGKSGIKAIFATPTRRAMQTAQPLAARLGIAVRTYDPRDPAALVSAVTAIPGGVLVVGHSNTVPDLVARFGATQAVSVGEHDYGTVFIVSPADGRVSAIEVRAGR